MNIYKRIKLIEMKIDNEFEISFQSFNHNKKISNTSLSVRDGYNISKFYFVICQLLIGIV